MSMVRYQRFRHVLGALFLVGLVCGTAHARETRGNRPANTASRKVHDEATRILNSIQDTKYKHQTQIDEKKGEYYCDCSGFVGYVLGRSVGSDEKKTPLSDGRGRPLAMDYEKFFAAAPTEPNGISPWQRVVRLADARPGDVIAWRHEVPKPGNTGHVVIVAERPVLEDNGLVRVVMIDSTTRPQVDDTRAKGTSGIGRGTMWFTIDEEGRPTGTVRGSITAKPVYEAVSIGRAVPVKERSSKKRAA